MSWTATTRRRVRTLIEVIAAPLEVTKDTVEMTYEARSLLPFLRERKRIPQSLPGPSRKEAREAKRRKHAAETDEIRKARLRIAKDQCEQMEMGERCGVIDPLGNHLHMHHLEGGSGRRRQRQTVQNVRIYCEAHHRDAHRATKRTA